MSDSQDQNSTDTESRSMEQPETVNDTSSTTNDQHNESGLSAEVMLSAVNSKDMVESLKGRIIATNKLLKHLQTAKSESDAEKLKIDTLTKQLNARVAEVTSLQHKLQLEKTTNQQLSEKLAQSSGTTTVNSQLQAMQQNLKQLTEQKEKSDSLLSSREMYIKQLEAQLDSLESKLKSQTNIDHKKRDNDDMLDKKNKQIKDLQQQLNKAQKLHEAAEDDKMEMNINNEMLKRDYEEVKEQVERLERQIQQQQQEQDQMTTSNNRAVPFDKYEDVRQKLQQSYTRIDHLTTQVERLEQSNQIACLPSRGKQDYEGLVTEFKKCLAEIETMKKEKRVLQDKLTEQLVINEDINHSRRKSMLSYYGIDMTTPTSETQHDDTIHMDTVFEEIDSSSRLPTTTTITTAARDNMPLERHTSRHRLLHNQSLSPVKTSLGKRPAESESRITYGTNGLVVPESRLDRSTQQSTTRKTKMTKLEKLVGARRPATFGTSPTTSKQKSEPESVKTLRKRRIFSDSSSTSSSSSSSSGESDSDLDVLDGLPSGTTAKPKSSSTATTKQHKNPVEFMKLRADHLAKRIPTHTFKLLDDMEEFMDVHLDIFLATLETIYKGLKSHGIPLNKLDGKQQHEEVSSRYGVSGRIELQHCPKYMDTREKNIAWALWALVSLYPKNDPYSKVTTWATENALKLISKPNLACRYIRLLVLLCINAQDRQRMAVFCYDLARWAPGNINIMTPLVNIALLWPEILDLGDGTENAAGTHMMIKAIQRSCAAYCNQYKTPDALKAMNNYLNPLVHWPLPKQSQSLEDYIKELKAVLSLPHFKQLYGANRDAFNDLRINLVKSFELVYHRLDDWKATYNEFILKDLWQLMNDDILADTSLELMGLLARTGLDKESSKEDIATLRQTFKSILEVGNNCIVGKRSKKKKRKQEGFCN
ncbi:uncharacterized protein BX664DRAFT_148523 [Halteromyces radiatus]|uniref:uncharacterized protein n=1 Tax=Halteromyces radiatus TaxID=101107 RepID=UPI0022207796|nr:uncharacterized protein BX664DRAFT_148523 [Halteromyces radiatus]KAI8086003.1 hypothetical protein BX664DRAFT_148523 [Halteromyces radiatus]